MDRYLTPYVKQDLTKKIVFVTGPRQVGKTFLSKQLYNEYDYFNYDKAEHRLALKEANWDRQKPLVIFDELHKMDNWKQWLKGIRDTEDTPPALLVTGSAKLDTYTKVGDSLAGRYFKHRLHPIDLKEGMKLYPIEDVFERLWNCSGFPEPFLSGKRSFYRRWRNTHIDIILKQDLIDLETVKDIKSIETLVLLLRNRTGATVSYANLARDLEKDSKTIKRWLQLLENLYVIFKVTPYSKNIARSLLKEPKYFFYDFARIDNNDGAKLENLVASALLKELDFINYTQGLDTNLHFLRTKDGCELDFLVVVEQQPILLIEVKKSDDTPSKNFQHFSPYFPGIRKIQLVKDLRREKTYPNGTEIRSLTKWLSTIDLGADRFS